ncbi:hypothetical protein [Paracoccus sp. (in: a-proteobacteria)]|uniref:hypothetical protein n=1 Tax=Paracoccus sp. TaxID=267 RepID=UPI0035AED468
MVIVALILILAGSIAGAVIQWLEDASVWGIMLGYVAGGWAGLVLGLPLVFLIRALVPAHPAKTGTGSAPARTPSGPHRQARHRQA